MLSFGVGDVCRKNTMFEIEKQATSQFVGKDYGALNPRCCGNPWQGTAVR